MIVTVALNRHGLKKAKENGISPEFNKIFSGIEGVSFLRSMAKGAFADFEMTEEAYRSLAKRYKGRFNFSKEKQFDPF